MIEELQKAVAHNGPVLVDAMGEGLGWRDVHGNWHHLPLTTAQAEIEALRKLLAEIVPPKLIGESHEPYPEGNTTILMTWDWLRRARATLAGEQP